MTPTLAGMKYVDVDQGKFSAFSVRDTAAQVLHHPAHPQNGTQDVECVAVRLPTTRPSHLWVSSSLLRLPLHR